MDLRISSLLGRCKAVMLVRLFLYPFDPDFPGVKNQCGRNRVA